MSRPSGIATNHEQLEQFVGPPARAAVGVGGLLGGGLKSMHD